MAGARVQRNIDALRGFERGMQAAPKSFLKNALAVAAAILAAVFLAAPAGAAAAPSTRIVFAQGETLRAMGPHGERPHALARVPGGTIADVAATPDGRSIALLSNRSTGGPSGSARTIWLYRSGRGLRRVLGPFTTVADRSIGITSNGRTIAYGRSGEIGAVGSGGGHDRPLTSGGGGTAGNPSFGTQPGPGRTYNYLFYTRSNGVDSVLRRLDRDSGTEAALTAFDEYIPVAQATPRDDAGTAIAYGVLDREAGTTALMRMSVASTARRLITRLHAPDFLIDLSFSPGNARSLAFSVSRGNGSKNRRYSIRTIRTSGANGRVALGGLKSRPAGPVWTGVPPAT